MKTLTLRIPEALDAKLTKLARETSSTKSALVRDALEAFVENGSTSGELSAHDLAKDLCGSVDGPRDLATNKKYMDGYGR